MTTVSFPVTLTGNYQDGSVCSAADYRADFEKMRDAINHMHERFSSFTINGVHTRYQRCAEEWSITSASGDGTTYGVEDPSGPTPYGQAFWSSDPDEYTVLNVFKVPSWMQGIRVREISVVNLSHLPDQSNRNHNDTAVVYTSLGGNHLTFSAGTSGTLAHFTNGAQGSVTDIANVTYTNNAEIRGNDHEGTAATPVIKTATANRVIAPGDYIAVRAKGGVEFLSGGGARMKCFDLHWNFHVTLLCDAMVPVL